MPAPGGPEIKGDPASAMPPPRGFKAGALALCTGLAGAKVNKPPVRTQRVHIILHAGLRALVKADPSGISLLLIFPSPFHVVFTPFNLFLPQRISPLKFAFE